MSWPKEYASVPDEYPGRHVPRHVVGPQRLHENTGNLRHGRYKDLSKLKPSIFALGGIDELMLAASSGG